MRTLVLTSLTLLLASTASTAFAGDTLVWQSSHPTCQTIYSDGSIGPKGYATIHRIAGGQEYKRWCDFLDEPRAAMSDIGIPEDGFPTQASRGGATKFAILPNGHIKLY